MQTPSKKVLLRAWAEMRFDPVPSDHTLRRMAREGRIAPAPVLVGKCYYVEPSARLADDPAVPGRLVGELSR